MANGSYFRFDDDDEIKDTYSHKHKKKGEHAPYTTRKIIEGIDLILDKLDKI